MRSFKKLTWKKASYGNSRYGYIENVLFFSVSPETYHIDNIKTTRWILKMYLPGYKEAVVKTRRDAFALAKMTLVRFGEKFLAKQLTAKSGKSNQTFYCSKSGCKKVVSKNFHCVDGYILCPKCWKKQRKEKPKIKKEKSAAL